MADNLKGVNWDLTKYFPEFGGKEMTEFKAAIVRDVAELQKLAAGLDTLCAANAGEWETLFVKYENLDARAGHLGSYIGCLTSAHAENEAYAKEDAWMSEVGAEFAKLDIDFQRGMREVTDKDFADFVARPALKDATNFLNRLRFRAKKTMPPAMEKLAADLAVDGFHSWGRLYDTITGRMTFEMHWPDGKVETLPIAQCRALMADADRAVGRAAFEGGNKAWASREETFAAALNAIAGTRLKLNQYRGIEDYLDVPLYQAAITRRTLDAMYKAIFAEIELAREIFRVKASNSGAKGIAWFEREAPLALKDAVRYSWPDGATMVEDAFRSVYPALADFHKDFLDKRYIESEPRKGKRPGAYCTGSEVLNESRIFMTYPGSLSDISTMAHEMGHAFHSHVLTTKRVYARSYPMTLAETASTFAETLLAEGVYGDDRVKPMQKLLMLDSDLCSAAVMLLDITIRFEFEKAFHEERMKGEVSVSRFKEIMTETQRKVFGDAMVEGGEDPYFWASKLHFYITGISFYNFPYTFGFLLSRALYGMLEKEGPSFLPKYEEFLRLSGSDTVENVAMKALGVDVGDPVFWAASIKTLAQPLELYRKLLSELPKA